MTISTSGNSNPDIRVYDADGVEIPGMPGSWVVFIDRSILDKGNYVIIVLSGGSPGQSYSAVASFRVNEQALPATFGEGSIEPVYAQSTSDKVDSLKGRTFPALSTGIKRVWTGDGGSTSLTGNNLVSSITQNADGSATAVYNINGQEHVIKIPKDKYERNDYPNDIHTVGNINFQLSDEAFGTTTNPLNREYYRVHYWDVHSDTSDHGYSGHVVFGARTGAELPMGTVRYDGQFFGRFHSAIGDPTWTPELGDMEGATSNRRALWGEIHLEADLDDLSICGNVDNLWMQSPIRRDANDNRIPGEWSELPDTTEIAILEGSIGEGRFVTTWEGRDTDPNNPAETSARGFSGDIVGDFYGPNAEEAAGNFNGRRAATSTTPEQVIWGSFGAELGDGCSGCTPILNFPEKFGEGSKATVYAQSATDTMGNKKGTSFPALSTGIKRVWTGDGGSTSLTGNNLVSSITQNADGSATAVYNINGREHVIKIPKDKYERNDYPNDIHTVGNINFQLSDEAFGTTTNPLNREYYRVHYWDVHSDTSDHGYSGHVVFGARTGAELPMGTVRYDGQFFGRFHSAIGDPTWTPDPGDMEGATSNRRALWGEIHLEADLDCLTISGNVDNLWMQSPIRRDANDNRISGEWSELPDTTEITISEGSIAGGRFVTTWEGRDTDSSNPSETSARGFSGDIVGDFYGPNAEEAAGNFNGRRAATSTTPEQVIWGSFGAEQRFGIGGTVIDLDTAFTGTPSNKESQFNDRERAAINTEPGNNNVLLLDGHDEPYDTYSYWAIDGADVTSKRLTTPKDEVFTLTQKQNLAPVAPTGYSIKYYSEGWSVPELDDLGIHYPVPTNDVPKEAGSEVVAAYTDKSDATDTDYLEFGWWRLVDFETDITTDPVTKELTVRFGAYARATSSTTTDLNGITGSATYSGSAVGQWRKTSPANAGGFRDGTVSLTANFDTNSISGTVTNLRTSLTNPVLDDTWAITLAPTSFDTQGIIARGATTTQDASAKGGYWSGMFQRGEDSSGNAVEPPAVTGKFTAHFDDGSVVGAFGANKD